MMHIVKDINDIDSNTWSIFVKNHPRGNVFQTLEMYQIYSITKNYEPIFIALTNAKKEILGLLTAVILKEHNGFIGKFSSRSIIHGGPIVANNDLDILNLLLIEYNKIIYGKAIFSQFRNIWDWSISEKSIFIKNGFNLEDHLDLLHDLSINKEAIFSKIHSGRKKNIRRAEKNGLTFNEVIKEDDFLECLELIVKTYKRIKLPIPEKAFFMISFKNLTAKGILKTFSATYDKKIIGTRLVLCYKGLIYDWYAGSDDLYLDKFTNDFLPWKIMEWGCLNNYQTFDFGGAGKPNKPYGVRDYKLKFGGELVNFGRFEKTHHPFLMKLGMFGFKIYKMIK